MSLATQRPITSLKAPLSTALGLLARGLWPIAIYPKGAMRPGRDKPSEGKDPIGKAWGVDRWTPDRFHEEFKRLPGAGVGICLGPERGPDERWLIDAEGDGPEAEGSRAALFGGEILDTMGWSSTRGEHSLLTIDPDRLTPILAKLKRCERKDQAGVYHLPNLPGLELRIGGLKADGKVKQLQSVCPPTKGTDGTPRRWNGVEEIAEAPDAFYAALERIAAYAVDLAVQSNTAKPSADGSFSWTVNAGGSLARYGGAALADECRILAETGEGQRNIQLNLSGFKVGRLVGAGAIASADAEAALGAAARQCGLGEGEIGSTLAGALKAGLTYPRDLSHVGQKKQTKAQRAVLKAEGMATGGNGGGSNGESIDTTPPRQGRACTDLGNAERLVDQYGADLRYCHPWKKWLVWDGRRWSIDNTGAVRRMAKRVVRKIYVEAASAPGQADREELAAHAINSEKKERIAAMIHLAEAESGMPILPDDMDSDPWSFNCQDGTIDLRTGEMRPHRRADRITTLCPIGYDPAATCPLWEQTLKLFLRGDEELIRYWQRICGCAMAGAIRDAVLPVAYGAGANGKSTILGALLNVFGPDYAMKAMPDLLMAKKQDTHPTDKADLFGKRLVVAIETEAGRRLNETQVKELTGGDRIRARRMREDPWEFEPTHTLIMATNHKPRVRGTDHGIWRRLKLVPFTVAVNDKEADKAMPEKLRAEYPGILAWCVRGCLAWQKEGLEPPKAVEDATTEYRQEQDILGQFLEEHTISNPNAKAKAGHLYQRYKEWAKEGEEFVMTQTAFGLALVERGFEKSTSNGVWYRGIGLRAASPACAPREEVKF